MKKRIKLCITMALRDYAAFEDLAAELGLDVSDVDIVNADEKQRTIKKRRSPVYLATVVWDRIKKFSADYELPEQLGYTEVRRRLIVEFGKENVPSPETIRRVVLGKVDRPKRELIGKVNRSRGML